MDSRVVTAPYRCTTCGHEQEVYEIHFSDGHIYAGGRAYWCDHCRDGKPERVSLARNLLE